MPSHTVASALLSLFIVGKGAPWTFSLWQAITGVHDGPFPDDPKKLPKGIKQEDVGPMLSYIDQYKKIVREEDKIKFVSMRSQAQGGYLVARELWRDWVNDIWSATKMHARISAILFENDCHPITLISNNPELKNKAISNQYIPLSLDAIARALYGEESLDNAGRLAYNYRLPTQHLVQRTWINLCKQIVRNKARLASLEVIAREAFNGNYGLYFFRPCSYCNLLRP